MTPSEFKAWFDGFTEAFTGCPTKGQWTRIKARVAEIDGQPVTERVYVDRYLPAYIRTYPQMVPNWATTYCGHTGIGGASGGSMSSGAIASNAIGQGAISTFNSSRAMADLGRAEAASLHS